jgi:hypothetical protein
MSKGISQTDGIQAVGRGEIDLGPLFISGLAKNITSDDADGELQFAAGARVEIRHVEVSTSVTLKRWVATKGNPDDTAAEFHISVARPFGNMTARAQLFYSPDDLGSSNQSLYVEGGVSWQVTSRWQVSANVGRRNRHGGIDYTSANVGVDHNLSKSFTAELTAYATNRRAQGSSYEPRLVASLRARF